ncbi:ATP synthase F1 subunit gamma [Campylobacter ureolyticus]|uniref:ATP synthase gamma chain n=1 Tax=Campylobacter ureolyticus TaxID=827 RepID=A0A9Q4PU27_9BACT|nr:ATP synthase F1 subunit gamma [Campylobacter ureolyticus]MCZ6103811.1 ATP synthase F1 subunit gamma [Campylobacter ureolyticus]MCZ6134737.1 ATP synthase F1 subunit gamma [Campylobacter ureolyticus]MCZ6162023.1 ATP synthase F1 subunit gamma [Campylobacter ureolyticus]MCZ6170902.1 ATP synthase F1 subunit gamma [Campylobacter ureolyticus]MDU4981480.1 ATP synthase F1 subunit gamma [Campylobacter ureolyticus]
MANLKDIKAQIKSVQNTQKTTKAMKLVSNVKLKRAKFAALQSSAYAIKINEVLSEIANYAQDIEEGSKLKRLFDTNNEIKVMDIIFVTADKGLCGGFNAHTINAVKKLIKEYQDKKVKVRLRAVGKKGIEYFKFQGVEIYKSFIGVSSSPTYEKAQDIIEEAIDEFNRGETDKVVMVHNGYKNMISQEIRINDIAPVLPPVKSDISQNNSVIEFEPAKNSEKILEELMVKYLEYSMYYALVDSLAGEHSARMNAMENASNNAKERVASLNLAYNKARQGSITTELIEIISGVESMK